MSGFLQIALLAGDAVFLLLIFCLIKKGKLCMRFSLVWLALGGALFVFAAVPYILKVLRAWLHFEVVANLVFTMLFCFVLLVLLVLSSAASQQAERIKHLAQANAILEKRVRQLEEDRRDRCSTPDMGSGRPS